jgi:ribosomal 50S subunit-recycling heat shock protein
MQPDRPKGVPTGPPVPTPAPPDDKDLIVTLAVAEGAGGVRLDRFLVGTGRFSSRGEVHRLIREGKVTVAGRPAKPAYKLKPSQPVVVRVPPAKEAAVQAEPLPLHILYEDEDLIVVDKPAGMVVHPASGNESGTLVNALLYHCGRLSQMGGPRRPGNRAQAGQGHLGRPGGGKERSSVYRAGTTVPAPLGAQGVCRLGCRNRFGTVRICRKTDWETPGRTQEDVDTKHSRQARPHPLGRGAALFSFHTSAFLARDRADPSDKGPHGRDRASDSGRSHLREALGVSRRWRGQGRGRDLTDTVCPGQAFPSRGKTRFQPSCKGRDHGFFRTPARGA